MIVIMPLYDCLVIYGHDYWNNPEKVASLLKVAHKIVRGFEKYCDG